MAMATASDSSPDCSGAGATKRQPSMRVGTSHEWRVSEHRLAIANNKPAEA